ncbi:MAG: hypothetical protein IH602_01790 [Bryobacteraceae bacterium]|nr:hypothetical protein [Bryobacteraceae bacterium]
MLAESTLRAYLGKHISTICPIGFADDGDNHCAHFVSHVLGYQFGATCRTMKRGTGTPASIRVHDLFSHCVSVGKWDELPVPLFWGLVFITRASNVNLKSKVMNNVPRKHVGIFYGGMRTIYHYSNSRRQVVSQTPEQFSNHYSSPDNAMFWGAAP